MELPPPTWFADSFPLLLSGRDVPGGRMTEAIRDLVAGRVDEARAAAFLTALRMKGEAASEIAAAIRLRVASPDELDRMCEAGPIYYKQHFDPTILAERLAQHFLQLMAAHGR